MAPAISVTTTTVNPAALILPIFAFLANQATPCQVESAIKFALNLSAQAATHLLYRNVQVALVPTLLIILMANASSAQMPLSAPLVYPPVQLPAFPVQMATISTWSMLPACLALVFVPAAPQPLSVRK
jgi:hypothetical protein